MPFTMLPGVQLIGPLPRETLTVRHAEDEYVLDVAALTSNYRCIYGQGCQGVSPHEGEGPGRHLPADKSVTGCCRTQPGFGFTAAEVPPGERDRFDSPARLRPYVEQLTADEAQHIELIRAGEWFVEIADSRGERTARTAGVEGNCVFLNTEMGNGKTGCALFHLARRLGIDPAETRPAVCHSTPAAAFSIGTTNDGAGFRVLVTLRPQWYGWYDPDGYFCTLDPVAFSASEPVFARMESEYSTLLGPEVYTVLRAAFDEVWTERGERLRTGWGTPPEQGVPAWALEQRAERDRERDRGERAPAIPIRLGMPGVGPPA